MGVGFDERRVPVLESWAPLMDLDATTTAEQRELARRFMVRNGGVDLLSTLGLD